MVVEEILLSAAITGLSVFLSSYVMLKITIKRAKTDLKHELEAWLNSENGQKAIYQLGILLGNALMQGAGLQKPSKASGGFKGLIMEGITSYIRSKIPSLTGQTQETQAQPSEQKSW